MTRSLLSWQWPYPQEYGLRVRQWITRIWASESTLVSGRERRIHALQPNKLGYLSRSHNMLVYLALIKWVFITQFKESGSIHGFKVHPVAKAKSLAKISTKLSIQLVSKQQFI